MSEQQEYNFRWQMEKSWSNYVTTGDKSNLEDMVYFITLHEEKGGKDDEASTMHARHVR